MLLFPDPRPLVERLGLAFFRQAPACPGVYLMRDAADTVLYVGKAKNLRKRLGNYRVANPERMPRRHLRMLRAVERIEFEPCANERSALARESELLRTLRPRFNRAGTWPGKPRFFAWRTTKEALEIGVLQAVDLSWETFGPLGYSAFGLRIILVRLLWCALYPDRGLSGLPQGWFEGRYGEVLTIPCHRRKMAVLQNASEMLKSLFAGNPELWKEWILERTRNQTHAFEVAVRESDLEQLVEFGQRIRAKQSAGQV